MTTLSAPPAVSAAELLAILSARQLRDGQVVFAGVGIPLLAATLAQRLACPVVGRHLEKSRRRAGRRRAAQCRVCGKRRGIVIRMPAFVRMRDHESGSERVDDAVNGGHRVEQRVRGLLIVEAEDVQVRGTVGQVLERGTRDYWFKIELEDGTSGWILGDMVYPFEVGPPGEEGLFTRMGQAIKGAILGPSPVGYASVGFEI